MYKYRWCNICKREVRIPLTYWESQMTGLKDMFRWTELFFLVIIFTFFCLAMGFVWALIITSFIHFTMGNMGGGTMI